MKFEVGASTVFFVIQYESLVAQAKSTEVAAKSAYVKAAPRLSGPPGPSWSSTRFRSTRASRGGCNWLPASTPAPPHKRFPIAVRARDNGFVYLPRAFAQQALFQAAVGRAALRLAPQVVDIIPTLGNDWRGEPAVFFMVILADAASSARPALKGHQSGIGFHRSAGSTAGGMGCIALFQFPQPIGAGKNQPARPGLLDGISRTTFLQSLKTSPIYRPRSGAKQICEDLFRLLTMRSSIC